MSAESAAGGLAPSVVISQASVAFGGRVLADRLSFALEAGRTTCLLGPSGVGKTTLLKLVAGLVPIEPPASIRAGDGRPLAGRVAYMAQQDLLLPWLSVRDNVLLGHRLRGDTAALRDAGIEVDRLLAEVGLADRACDRPAALSGGMRQRAALARTLVERRPVVLMDEPFAGIDAIQRLELQELAARLLAGRTVALVTHDPLEALRLGHRVHVLTGRPVRAGPAIEPPGAPPRDPADPTLLELQARLLRELSAARLAAGAAP